MDIIQYIRHFVHDTSKTRYEDKLIQHYIDLAMVDFATKTQFFIKEVAVDVRIGEKIAAILPSDIIELTAVYLDNRYIPVVMESDLNDIRNICGVDLWRCKMCNPEVVILKTNVRELVLWPPLCPESDKDVDTYGVVTEATVNLHCKKSNDNIDIEQLFGILPSNFGVTKDIVANRLYVKYTYTPKWDDLYNEENTESTLATKLELMEVIKSFVTWKLLLQDDDNKSIAMSDREHQLYLSYVKEYKHRHSNLYKTRGGITVGNLNEFARR